MTGSWYFTLFALLLEILLYADWMLSSPFLTFVEVIFLIFLCATQCFDFHFSIYHIKCQLYILIIIDNILKRDASCVLPVELYLILQICVFFIDCHCVSLSFFMNVDVSGSVMVRARIGRFMFFHE